MNSSIITYPEIEGHSGSRSTLFSLARSILLEALQNARFLVRRQRTRNRLLELDSDQLYDMGLSRKEALEEGRKPFWK